MFFYSEKGRKTKIDEILRALKKKGVRITEEILEKSFKIFEKQSEVDYFINKNAKEFLKEQFDLWLYQYVFSGESEWTEKRIKQLQVLKDIAYKIIDFISQFEDELVKIWNKPKFVLNSNYVITLDRIAKQEGGFEVIEKILRHKNFDEQVKEWKDLGIVDEDFRRDNILENTITGKQLNKKYQFLPIDTKHFKDLEYEILGLFDDLDKSLDGWLIKSENYQALNTILPKFKEKIQTIYIDPPYNTGSDEFLYRDRYQHSSWLTMIENRLSLARELMRDDGVIFVSIGEKDSENRELHRLIGILDNIFGEYNWIQTFSIETANQSETNFVIRNKEFMLSYAKNIEKSKFNLKSKIQEARCTTSNPDQTMPVIEFPAGIRVEGLRDGIYKQDEFWVEGSYENLIFIEPKTLEIKEGRTAHPIKIKARWSNSNDLRNYFSGQKSTTKFGKEVVEVYFKKAEKGRALKVIMKKLGFEKPNSVLKFTQIGSNDLLNLFSKKLKEYIEKIHPKPIELVRFSTDKSFKESIILDFFAGSGTTAHAVMKLNKEDGGKRKFILVEMADYFYTVIIPRLKKVAYSFNWKDGKPQDTDGIGVFFKYYELEQYEDTLKRVKYEDTDLFDNPYQDPYNQYIFMKDLKMLEALEVDYENNKVKVDLSKLYQNIDIPEILSNLKGKWIKKITSDYVELEDGEKVNIKDLDYKLIKNLIWW